jgi:16S rRNA C1402 (ribose-2'-O) methylase RsmI
MQLQDYLNSSQNVTSEEAMFVIRDIAKAHQELMEKEKLREDWEMRTEVHRTRSLCRILFDCAHSYGIPCIGLRV